ncbi:MAG: Fe-S cluster assembly protein SufD [Actinobacteria bacterium]|nr:MAG: Fe-S cluster assembly protein SufD [Actinomycetota bacterium]
MTTPSTEFTADAAAALPGPAWMQQRRADALARFEARALPTEAEEVWRYSRIDELDLSAYRPVVAREAPTGLPAAVTAVADAAGPRSGLLVMRDGRLSHAELRDDLSAKGVVLGSLLQAAPDEGAEVLGAVAGAPDAFVELATAFLGEAAFVRVPSKVELDAPLVVVHWLDTDGGAVFPRTLVQVGESSQAGVIEVAASDDVAGLAAPVVELDVGDAANLAYLGLQQLGSRVWQVAYQASRVGRDASLRSFTAALGGGYARLRTDSRLAGQGGSTQLMAAFFGAGDQMHDFRTLQDHDAPRTTSDLLFKGAVRDRARSVYSGLIRIRHGAHGSNAFQTNRNLVLSEGAHADSVPNLEIEENDVRCSHASTVGPIDEEQRYYLESRGVPPAAADRLIVGGFFGDILDRAPAPGVRARLRQAVNDRLESD